MRLSSTSSLALATLAGLGSAVPFHGTDSLHPEAWNETLWNTMSMQRREDSKEKTDSTHFCNDQLWKPFGERAFLAGLRLMGKTNDHSMKMGDEARAQIPDQYLGTEGMCTNLWCGGDHKKGRGVVFYLCLQEGTPDKLFNSKDLALKFHDGFYDCMREREPQDDKDQTSLAFHVWGKGYDLHVENGYDTTECPKHMKMTAFPRPAALNYVPYSNTPKPQ